MYLSFLSKQAEQCLEQDKNPKETLSYFDRILEIDPYNERAIMCKDKEKDKIESTINKPQNKLSLWLRILNIFQKK